MHMHRVLDKIARVHHQYQGLEPPPGQIEWAQEGRQTLEV